MSGTERQGGFGDLSEDWLTTDQDFMDKIIGTGYAREKRYTKATDGHGHSSKVQIKMHSSEAAQIMRWVNYPAAQYNTMQDFVRDAIAHRLHDMHQFHMNGTMDEAGRQYFLAAEMDALKVRRVERIEFLKLVEETVASLLDDGQVTEAAEKLGQVREVVEDWPERQRKLANSTVEVLQARITSAVRGR